MRKNLYIYGMIACAGLFLLFQFFGTMIYSVSHQQSGRELFDLALVSAGLFLLLQGLWLHQEKRDWIALVYFGLCAVSFVYLLLYLGE